MPAPIALFAFNRPDKLKACLETLSENQGAISSDLYIFVDGPRHSEDLIKVKKVSDVAKHAKGFLSVSVNVSEKNLGLAKSIRSGISTVLRNHDSIIVVEDDLILANTFLEFMNAGLAKFCEDKRVASIQGFQYPVTPPLNELVAIRGADCWGWATWKDRWESTSFDTTQLLGELNSRELENEFDLDGSMPYTKMLENQGKGLIDSWAICWHASMFLQNRVSIHPNDSLVFNGGNDGCGTHKNRSRMFDTKLGAWRPLISWPEPLESPTYRAQLITFYRTNFGSTQPLFSRIFVRFTKIVARLAHR